MLLLTLAANVESPMALAAAEALEDARLSEVAVLALHREAVAPWSRATVGVWRSRERSESGLLSSAGTRGCLWRRERRIGGRT